MKFAFLAICCIGVGFLSACNKGESAGTDPDPVVRSDNTATVHITGNDKMRYNVTRFSVHPGEKVRIIFENIGKMPITTMGHDLVILKPGYGYKSFANEVQAADLQEKGEIADSLLDKVIAHTKVLGPGEKQVLDFTAPAVGSYDYLCTFPTHFAFMHGEMIVQ